MTRNTDLRHLIYHIWPLRGSLWEWNLSLLREKLYLFNGKKVFTIAIDHNTEEIPIVLSAIVDVPTESFINYRISDEVEIYEYISGIKIFVLNNTGSEVVPFIHHLMPEVSEEEGVTFYGHAKGVRYGHCDLPNVKGWILRMVEHNLTKNAISLLS